MSALIPSPAAFPNPWSARAFAMVNALAQVGWFTLKEFQQALITSISASEASGACIADETTYYDCWIEALTGLLHDRGVSLQRLKKLEAVVSDRLAAMAHDHDDHDEHEPMPIFTEAAQ